MHMESLPSPAADIYSAALDSYDRPLQSEINLSKKLLHLHSASQLRTDSEAEIDDILKSLGHTDTDREFLDEYEEESDFAEEPGMDANVALDDLLGSEEEEIEYWVAQGEEHRDIIVIASESTEYPQQHIAHENSLDDVDNKGDEKATEGDESAMRLALLEPDTDIAPSLPVVEVLFEETLHEMFYSSSAAFKMSRSTLSTRGALLFAHNECLLKEPLSVLFERLREDLLVARYGAEAAPLYEMSMVFKGLDDLWLLEHEDAASRCSLFKLVHLYMTTSGMRGQEEMLLEPFRIELKVQETFLSHLSRLEHLSSDRAQQSLATAAENEGLVELKQADTYVLDTEVDELVQEGNDSAPAQSAAEDAAQTSQEAEMDGTLETSTSSDPGEGEIDVASAHAADAAHAATSIAAAELKDDAELFDISEIDMDSLATVYEVEYDADPEDKRAELRIELAAHGSLSPTGRSPKRSLEELIDLIDDDFVNELSPDHVYKKTKAST